MHGYSSHIGAETRSWPVFLPSGFALTFSIRKKPTDEDLLIVERGLQRVRDDLAERRKAIERLEASQVCINCSCCPVL